MRGNNFVAFLTVQGFFLGLVIAVLQAQSAVDILTYTFLISIFFYLFSHLFVALYYRTFLGKKGMFSKERHEKDLDYYIREIEKRELSIDEPYDMSSSVNFISASANTQANVEEAA
ncbi:MAG: hypothetical protein U9P71_09620 [Campylobacterota bacterium]|nr:hypothetical protein [Campylobacterota bacterium]